MRSRVALLVLVGIVSLAAAPARAGAGPSALTGMLRVFMCNDTRCERPAADAPGWFEYDLGTAGVVGGIEHNEGVGWVIVSFTLPADFAIVENPALLMTNPADAEIATLNGMHAGGEGVVGPRYVAVPGGPRFLALPHAALRPGPNELALKVLFAELNTTAFSGPLLFGERDGIALECEVLRRPLLAAEAAFMSLFLVMIAFFAFLISRGVVRSDYLLFSLFLALYTSGFLLDSHLMFISGFITPSTEHLQIVLMRAITLVVLTLVTTITGRRFGLAYRLFAVLSVALLLAVIVLPPLYSLHLLVVPRKIMLGLLGTYYLVLAVLAMRERRPDAIPVFVGVAAYVAGSRLDLYWGIAARDYGTGVFALAMLYTITSRHSRLRERVEEITGRLLDAHEEERRRIARDIHDGVGQSLLALRLKLQMASGKVGAARAAAVEALPALAGEAGSIVEELRRTVLDLRPAVFESTDLVTALRAYAVTIAARGGFELHFHEGRQPLPDLSPRVRTHLFRILQEMLANVQRHAAATRVDVSLHRDGAHLVLQVADDGQGAKPGEVGGGIGLQTMRERAELLGGTFTLENAQACGTAVTVEIPLP